MKLRHTSRPLLLSLVAVAGLFSAACTHDGGHEDKKIAGSIRPSGKPEGAALAALAKVSFADAAKAATTAVPGTVIKGKLEIEDGFLIYDFKIAEAGKKISKVKVDAGDARVLEVESDND